MTTGPRLDPKAPVAGALVWVDFRGARGSEQAGFCPALVVSTTLLNRTSHRSFVCPITPDLTPYPIKVLLPDGLPVQGAVLADRLQSIDRSSRVLRVIGQAPDHVLAQVRAVIAQLLMDSE